MMTGPSIYDLGPVFERLTDTTRGGTPFDHPGSEIRHVIHTREGKPRGLDVMPPQRHQHLVQGREGQAWSG